MPNDVQTAIKYTLAGRQLLERIGPECHIVQLTAYIMSTIDTEEFAEDDDTGPERYVACVCALVYGYLKAGGEVRFSEMHRFEDVGIQILSIERIENAGDNQDAGTAENSGSHDNH